MRNVIIGAVIVLVLIGGWWFLATRIPQTEKGGMQTAEEMVECPVMGTKLLPSRAYSKTEYRGKTYYFCCPGCPGEFKKNPEKYAR